MCSAIISKLNKTKQNKYYVISRVGPGRGLGGCCFATTAYGYGRPAGARKLSDLQSGSLIALYLQLIHDNPRGIPNVQRKRKKSKKNLGRRGLAGSPVRFV
jgi:hypothetical protein